MLSYREASLFETMKKYFLFSVLIFFIWSSPVSFKNLLSLEADELNRVDANNSYPFENVQWGMSLGDVQKRIRGLKHSTHRAKELLSKYIMFEGVPTNLVFHFYKKRLIGVWLNMGRHKTHVQQYIDDYNKIERIMIKRHGFPSDKKTVWKNEADRLSKKPLAESLRQDKIEFFSLWKRKNKLGTIKHELKNAWFSKTVYCITHWVAYLNPDYDKIEKQSKAKK